MKKPQTNGWGNGMRKWEGEKGPPKNVAWPRGLNPVLNVAWNDIAIATTSARLA